MIPPDEHQLLVICCVQLPILPYLIVYFSLILDHPDSFAIWALIFEGYESTSALKRSKELVKNYWWAVVGRAIAIGLIFWAIVLIFAVPLFFMNEFSLFAIIWGFVLQITQIVISPIFVIYNYLIFRDLVNIKGESQVERKKGVVGIIVAVLAIFTVSSANGLIISISSTLLSEFKLPTFIPYNSSNL